MASLDCADVSAPGPATLRGLPSLARALRGLPSLPKGARFWAAAVAGAGDWLRARFGAGLSLRVLLLQSWLLRHDFSLSRLYLRASRAVRGVHELRCTVLLISRASQSCAHTNI